MLKRRGARTDPCGTQFLSRRSNWWKRNKQTFKRKLFIFIFILSAFISVVLNKSQGRSIYGWSTGCWWDIQKSIHCCTNKSFDKTVFVVNIVNKVYSIKRKQRTSNFSKPHLSGRIPKRRCCGPKRWRSGHSCRAAVHRSMTASVSERDESWTTTNSVSVTLNFISLLRTSGSSLPDWTQHKMQNNSTHKVLAMSRWKKLKQQFSISYSWSICTTHFK